MRVRKPYFREQTQSWYVKLDGHDVPLGKDEAEAWDHYHELMAERARTGKMQIANDSVVTLINRYLDWLEKTFYPGAWIVGACSCLAASAWPAEGLRCGC